MALFDHRCALRTWLIRVAHNVGASHAIRRRRANERLVALEALDIEAASIDGGAQADSAISAAKLLELIHQLKTVDRQIMLLHWLFDVERRHQNSSDQSVVEPPVHTRSKSWNMRINTATIFPLPARRKESGNRFIDRRSLEWQ